MEMLMKTFQQSTMDHMKTVFQQSNEVIVQTVNAQL